MMIDNILIIDLKNNTTIPIAQEEKKVIYIYNAKKVKRSFFLLSFLRNNSTHIIDDYIIRIII